MHQKQGVDPKIDQKQKEAMEKILGDSKQVCALSFFPLSCALSDPKQRNYIRNFANDLFFIISITNVVVSWKILLCFFKKYWLHNKDDKKLQVPTKGTEPIIKDIKTVTDYLPSITQQIMDGRRDIKHFRNKRCTKQQPKIIP